MIHVRYAIIPNLGADFLPAGSLVYYSREGAENAVVAMCGSKSPAFLIVELKIDESQLELLDGAESTSVLRVKDDIRIPSENFPV